MKRNKPIESTRKTLFPTGYAGICKRTGAIVDRRKNPDSFPLPKSNSLGTPSPKQLDTERNQNV